MKNATSKLTLRVSLAAEIACWLTSQRFEIRTQFLEARSLFASTDGAGDVDLKIVQQDDALALDVE